MLRRKLQRSEVVSYFEKLPPCTVVLEACGAAHFWARTLIGLGHDAKLIAPEAVRPFVKKHKKNDPADAEGLVTAGNHKGTKFVPVKDTEQRGILSIHTARALLVKQQTMLSNSVRGLAAEFGHTAAKGTEKLAELVSEIEADELMPARTRQAIVGLYDQFRALDEGHYGWRRLAGKSPRERRRRQALRRPDGAPWVPPHVEPAPDGVRSMQPRG